jgi:hypothetical protein
MVIERNPKKIGKLNKAVLRMWAFCDDITQDIENIFNMKLVNDVHSIKGNGSIEKVLASYGWKHWKHYPKLWDISGFIVEVKKFVSRCETGKTGIEEDSGGVDERA